VAQTRLAGGPRIGLANSVENRKVWIFGPPGSEQLQAPLDVTRRKCLWTISRLLGEPILRRLNMSLDVDSDGPGFGASATQHRLHILRVGMDLEPWSGVLPTMLIHACIFLGCISRD
jgi:hypothetical protein